MNAAIEGNQIIITRLTPTEQAIARNIPCRVWDRRRQGWRYPIRPEIVEELSLALKVPIPQEARVLCAEIRERESKVKEAKLAGWEDIEVTEPMPIKNATPFQHQKLAYELSCQLLGVYN